MAPVPPKLKDEKPARGSVAGLVVVMILATAVFVWAMNSAEFGDTAASARNQSDAQESAHGSTQTGIDSASRGSSTAHSNPESTTSDNRYDDSRRHDIDVGEVDAIVAEMIQGSSGTVGASSDGGGTPWSVDDLDVANNNRQGTQDKDELLTSQTEDPYPRDAVIAGRVINESGMAIVGIGVTATAAHLYGVPPEISVPVQDLQRHAVSDSAGNFRFSQMVPGEYRVNNLATDSYGAAQISVRTGVEFAELLLRDLREFHVTGVVRDTAGSPLVAALVQPQGIGARAAYTDVSGRFELPLRVSSGANGVALRTQLHGYRSKLSVVGADQVRSGGSATLNIELEPLDILTTVSGIVREASDGLPLANRSVHLNSLRGRQRHAATTNAEGRFAMPSVEANQQYEMLVTGGGGYSAWTQSGITVSDMGLDIDIVLQADESIPLAGRMLNLNGTPIPHYSLTVRAQNPPYQTMRVTSDGNGNFVIPHPPDGVLVFESRSEPRMMVSGVHVAATGNQQITLMLDLGRNDIYGRIVNADGVPVSVPNVSLSWRHMVNGMQSSSSRQSPADSQGQFAFSGLGPGIHTIRVDAAGYAPMIFEHDPARDGYQITVRLVSAPPG